MNHNHVSATIGTRAVDPRMFADDKFLKRMSNFDRVCKQIDAKHDHVMEMLANIQEQLRTLEMKQRKGRDAQIQSQMAAIKPPYLSVSRPQQIEIESRILPPNQRLSSLSYASNDAKLENEGCVEVLKHAPTISAVVVETDFFTTRAAKIHARKVFDEIPESKKSKISVMPPLVRGSEIAEVYDFGVSNLLFQTPHVSTQEIKMESDGLSLISNPSLFSSNSDGTKLEDEGSLKVPIRTTGTKLQPQELKSRIEVFPNLALVASKFINSIGNVEALSLPLVVENSKMVDDNSIHDTLCRDVRSQTLVQWLENFPKLKIMVGSLLLSPLLYNCCNGDGLITEELKWLDTGQYIFVSCFSRDGVVLDSIASCSPVNEMYWNKNILVSGMQLNGSFDNESYAVVGGRGDRSYGVFDIELSAALRKLLFNRHFLLQNVEIIDSEVDGYQLHLISIVPCFKCLIGNPLNYFKKPAEVSVDVGQIVSKEMVRKLIEKKEGKQLSDEANHSFDRNFFYYIVALLYEDGLLVDSKEFAYDCEQISSIVGTFPRGKFEYTIELDDVAFSRNNGNPNFNGNMYGDGALGFGGFHSNIRITQSDLLVNTLGEALRGWEFDHLFRWIILGNEHMVHSLLAGRDLIIVLMHQRPPSKPPFQFLHPSLGDKTHSRGEYCHVHGYGGSGLKGDEGREWWNDDVEEVVKQGNQLGLPPKMSDAHTINGKPGPLFPCSEKHTHAIEVEQGKTYLLRIINAALNDELFFAISGHSLTVVEVDAVYTKPFTTEAILIAPGQTTNVLVRANQIPGRYFMAARAFMDAGLPIDNRTAIAILQYKGIANSVVPSLPQLPALNDTSSALTYNSKLRSLNSPQFPCNVPLKVDRRLFYTIGLGVNPCPTCQNGTQLTASLNNITFVMPQVGLLQAHYFSLKGVFTADFPDRPLTPFNYTGATFTNLQTTRTKLPRISKIAFNSTVELVLQDTNLLSVESHPFHLHGYNFFVVGTGIGNFDPKKDPAKFNLVDPPERNTVGVPTGGWTAIRFRTDNPGVWFMHCHLELHTGWGLKTAFVVEDGPDPDHRVLPPPKDLPSC